MTVGETIKTLRVGKNMTQKEFGDKLYVTAQAVSRWEQNLVEPSIETLKQMAGIFGVSVGQLLGEEELPEKKDEAIVSQVTSEDVKKEVNDALSSYKRKIGVCDKCHKPILEGEEVHSFPEKRGARTHNILKAAYMLCDTCYEEEMEEEKKEERNKLIHKRTLSFGWSISVGSILLLIAVLSSFLGKNPGTIALNIVYSLIGSYVIFSLIFVCIADNTKISDIFLDIVSVGFVKMPGIIFSLDIDGLVFLILGKIFLFCLSLLLMVGGLLLGVLICVIPSAIMFPVSLKRLNQEIKDSQPVTA